MMIHVNMLNKDVWMLQHVTMMQMQKMMVHVSYAAEGFDCAGNCLSGELLTMNMNDSWGDGWNGAVLTINGVDYTVETGSSATACVDLLACNIVSWTAGSYDSETSWSVGELSGEAGFRIQVHLDNCAPTTATVEFAVDMNGVDQPSADYDQVVVNGSWNGWQGWGVILADEDGDGIFTGSLEVDPGTSFEYVVAVSGAADGWSGWGMQWGDGCANANVAVTAGDAGSVTSTSLSAGCADVVGCMDANASNYNADATVQGYDQYGNLQCVYASCDDIPEYGCIYADGFGAFNEFFDAAACSTYGGTPCEEPVIEVPGCTEPAANNYNADATVDDGSCEFDVNCDEAIAQAYADGAASVDITSDNQGVADEAYGWGYGDGYGAGSADGAASVLL